MFISKIIISKDFLGIKEEMINNFGIKKLRFFIP
ncbi:DNA polymerase III subunit delta', partial [Campylobacter jejuni]|nr:DNA polymerase III subunit delta' [Campylobacter jejuni]